MYPAFVGGLVDGQCAPVSSESHHKRSQRVALPTKAPSRRVAHLGRSEVNLLCFVTQRLVDNRGVARGLSSNSRRRAADGRTVLPQPPEVRLGTFPATPNSELSIRQPDFPRRRLGNPCGQKSVLFQTLAQSVRTSQLNKLPGPSSSHAKPGQCAGSAQVRSVFPRCTLRRW